MTDYEKAMIRLRAFEVLGEFDSPTKTTAVEFGEGKVTVPRKLDFSERQHWAEKLTEWAIS